MLLIYCIKLNSSQVPNVLAVEQTNLFVKHTIFLCDCFKSIKSWKTIVLGFVKNEHSIIELVKFPKSKEEKLLDHIH